MWVISRASGTVITGDQDGFVVGVRPHRSVPAE